MGSNHNIRGKFNHFITYERSDLLSRLWYRAIRQCIERAQQSYPYAPQVPFYAAQQSRCIPFKIRKLCVNFDRRSGYKINNLNFVVFIIMGSLKFCNSLVRSYLNMLNFAMMSVFQILDIIVVLCS